MIPNDIFPPLTPDAKAFDITYRMNTKEVKPEYSLVITYKELHDNDIDYKEVTSGVPGLEFHLLDPYIQQRIRKYGIMNLKCNENADFECIVDAIRDVPRDERHGPLPIKRLEGLDVKLWKE